MSQHGQCLAWLAWSITTNAIDWLVFWRYFNGAFEQKGCCHFLNHFNRIVCRSNNYTIVYRFWHKTKRFRLGHGISRWTKYHYRLLLRFDHHHESYYDSTKHSLRQAAKKGVVTPITPTNCNTNFNTINKNGCMRIYIIQTLHNNTLETPWNGQSYFVLHFC